ncbi:MAG: FHA domain-containing protein [Acidobacteria bacterium]|nr:FHA domain-containing protein [Acidobacteriota bacterium]
MTGFVLIHFDPEGGERRFDLEDGRSYRLGARDDNDIVIDQQDVSRHHAILRVSGGAFHITDLKSKNGTFINGNRAEEAQFRAGDLLGLSSARLIVVEPGSDEFTPGSGDHGSAVSGDTSNTVERQIQISIEELLELLDVTGHAARHSAVAEPLGWAGRALGLKASLLLYCDDEGHVSIVSSAGDLGPLMTNSEALMDLVRNARQAGRHSTLIRRFHDVDEDLLVAPVDEDHYLVIRYGDSAPAVGDIRALIASIEAVVGSSGRGDKVRQWGGSRPPSEHVERGSLDLDALLSMPLAEGRDLFEQWFVSSVLDACSGNQSEAARRLGVSRAGLFKKLKKLGLKE